MATTNHVSSIALALAGKTASVDIPKPHDAGFWTGRDTFAAVAARSLPAGKQPAGLLTPPNSISPSLPPQGFKDHATAAPLTPPAAAHVDSDIDLQDAVDHAKAQDNSAHGLGLKADADNLGGLDTTGAISPALLAKHHLPGILLEHGPLAIRHVMGYLTTSVPGFSSIPPAKARRIVVGALEGRGSGGEQGGIHGDVIFEKVGWGRWDAKQRDTQTRDSRGPRAPSSRSARHPSPAASHRSLRKYTAFRIPISSIREERRRDTKPGTSITGESAVFSHDSEMDYGNFPGDHNMHENEADKMSLDGDDEGDRSCSSSEAPDEAAILDDDLGDVTDEEDWASIGAAALRQGSFPLQSGGGRNPNYLHTRFYSKGRGGGPPTTALAKSTPSAPMPMYNISSHSRVHDWNGFAAGVPAGFVGGDEQERDAVEALLRLSSV